MPPLRAHTTTEHKQRPVEGVRTSASSLTHLASSVPVKYDERSTMSTALRVEMKGDIVITFRTLGRFEAVRNELHGTTT